MAPDPTSVQAWLRPLAQAGLVRLTPRTAVAVEELLRLPLAEEPKALAAALASLLTHDEKSWVAVEASFLEWYGRTTARSEGWGVGRIALRVGRRGRGAGLVAVVVVVMWGAVVGIGEVGTSIEEQQPNRRVTPTVLDPPQVVAVPEPEDSAKPLEVFQTVSFDRLVEARSVSAPDATTTTTIDAPSPGPTWVVTLLLVICFALVLLAARWWTAPGSYRRAQIRIQKRAKAHRRELLKQVTRKGVPYHIEMVPPLSPEAIEDSATMLARLTTAGAGWEIDVEPTVRRTIEAGGRLRIVNRPSTEPQGLLVLVDVEKGDHPDLHRVDRLIAMWQRGGLHVDRYDFRFRPNELRPRPRGEPIDLVELSRRHEGAPVLVISRMYRPEDPRGELDWLAPMARWPNRAWLDLDPRPAAERESHDRTLLEEFERAGLPRFPFTGPGVLACARTLAAGGEHPAPIDDVPLPSVDALAPVLQRWAACACVVPDPVWPQLDAFRRTLPELHAELPEASYVHRLIEWLQRDAAAAGLPAADIGYGDRLTLPEQQRRRLVADLRQADRERRRRRQPALEDEARRLVISQLEAAKVEGDPFEAQKRDFKLDLHRALLEPELARELLPKWAHTGMATELRAALDDEHWLQRGQRLPAGRGWDEDVWREVEAWREVDGGSEARGTDLVPWRGWTRRTGLLAVVGAIIVGGSWAAWWWKWPEILERTETVLGDRVELPSTWEAEITEVREVAATTKLRPALMRLPGGRFMMGSNRFDDEKPVHEAQVAPFEICRTEVTQGQWTAVMGTTRFDENGGIGDDRPAHSISWEMAVEYLAELTKRENELRKAKDEALTQCYEKVEGQWSWTNRECTGFRLPTETEWEYAARAGTQTEYSFGDDVAELGKYGWFDDNSENETHPVAKLRPNPWGLYDVHGNVWEWVWDWYREGGYEAEAAARGYAGPVTGEYRVLRGGSFGDAAEGLRSASRNWYQPANSLRYDGFRCVRGLGPEPSTP